MNIYVYIYVLYIEIGNVHPFQYSCLRNPMDREPGRLQSSGLQRVRHNRMTEHTHTHTHLMYTYISCTYIYPEYLFFIYLYIFCITKPTSKSLNFSSQCYWWLWELNRTLNVVFPILVYVACFFPVVMYKCESQTIKKAEHWRIDAFEVWCWRRLLRVPWTARKSNQSILKEINPKYSLEGLMLMLKIQYLGHLMRRTDSLEKTLMLGKAEGRRRRGLQRMRLDDITRLMDMNWSKFQGLMIDGEVWCAAVPGIAKSQTWLNNWAKLKWVYIMTCQLKKRRIHGVKRSFNILIIFFDFLREIRIKPVSPSPSLWMEWCSSFAGP